MPDHSGNASFETTHWSVVLAASDTSQPESRRALETLCKMYWYPLYAYARRRNIHEAEARDLTQSFFAYLLERTTLAKADPRRGGFRSFLLTAFKNFLANQWDKEKAAKRGGGRVHFSLDFPEGEGRYSVDAIEEDTPEKLFDRQWALTVLEHVLSCLRDEYCAAGKDDHFIQLQAFLSGQAEAGAYAEVARQLSLTEGAARVAAHRLRRRYRELLRREIAQTLDANEDVDDEIRRMFGVLS